MASLSKEDHEGSPFLKFYEWLHKRVPKYVDCRPIYVADSIREAGYKITKTEEFMVVRLAPFKIVIAAPEFVSSLAHQIGREMKQTIIV